MDTYYIKYSYLRNIITRSWTLIIQIQWAICSISQQYLHIINVRKAAEDLNIFVTVRTSEIRQDSLNCFVKLYRFWNMSAIDVTKISRRPSNFQSTFINTVGLMWYMFNYLSIKETKSASQKRKRPYFSNSLALKITKYMKTSNETFKLIHQISWSALSVH